ncbi:MAG TPA: hypothetical protein PLM53_16115 [Spirochaetota bacterium]|nr:hypothetical protein [Spirochaetota bacterium]HQF10028.1 hypothetical protein [Spirochaetota bacterium]HQH98623.1 hypothetical protein [Spirochaetota bacterium]HQJ72100.1 hypothetical protein [Spirochaetota bacterium]HRT77000.1 hypothetical protein [Spirochaetota bacterium]
MNYKIISSKEETAVIRLQRTRTLERILGVIFFLIGIVFLPIGLILFLAPEYDIHYPFFWTGFGLLFLMGGIMVSTQLKIPEFIEFDNGEGACIVRDTKKDDSDRAVIPYGEIEGFHVHSRMNDRSKSHAVEMEKKDGAFWTLFSVKSREAAEAFHERLAQSVNLSVASSKTGEQKKPDHVEIAKSAGATTLTWKNRHTLKSWIFLILALSSMGMLMYGSKPYAEGPVQYCIAVGFICLVTATAVFSLLNNIGRKHQIDITGDTFTYRKLGGIIKSGQFSIPIGEIDSILFNSGLSTMETVIYVLKKEEKIMLQEIKRGTFQKNDIFKAIALMKSIRKIEVGDLSIAGKVALENLLQKTVQELSGRKGL